MPESAIKLKSIWHTLYVPIMQLNKAIKFTTVIIYIFQITQIAMFFQEDSECSHLTSIG